MDSGPGTAYAHYRICTPIVLNDFRVLEAQVILRGDRTACGVHSQCSMVSDSPNQVCMEVALQGHDEGGPLRIGNPNDGRRRSEILLAVTAIAKECLPFWEVRWHGADDDIAKAPLNNAPCFTHSARTGEPPNPDANYRFKVGGPGSLRIELSKTSATFALQLRLANGTEVARPTPPTSLQPQRIVYRVTGPAEYVVRPQPISGPSNYQIDVFFTPDS